MNDELVALVVWLVVGYVPSFGLGLLAVHWLTRTRPTTDRIILWLITPAICWSVATLVSKRSTGFGNVIEFPLLAFLALAAYWWPLYWPIAEDRQGNRREFGVLIALNSVAALMGGFFPSLGTDM